MTGPTTMTPPEDAGLEGSRAACDVLVTLHQHPEGLTLEDLGSLLALDARTLRRALIGLSERRRIKSVSRTIDARWFTSLHAAALQEVRP
jgi:DNA-binding IclR family transcriptional regulator